jgi:myosin heavy subunit
MLRAIISIGRSRTCTPRNYSASATCFHSLSRFRRFSSTTATAAHLDTAVKVTSIEHASQNSTSSKDTGQNGDTRIKLNTTTDEKMPRMKEYYELFNLMKEAESRRKTEFEAMTELVLKVKEYKKRIESMKESKDEMYETCVAEMEALSRELEAKKVVVSRAKSKHKRLRKRVKKLRIELGLEHDPEPVQIDEGVHVNKGTSEEQTTSSYSVSLEQQKQINSEVEQSTIQTPTDKSSKKKSKKALKAATPDIEKVSVEKKQETRHDTKSVTEQQQSPKPEKTSKKAKKTAVTTEEKIKSTEQKTDTSELTDEKVIKFSASSRSEEEQARVLAARRKRILEQVNIDPNRLPPRSREFYERMKEIGFHPCLDQLPLTYQINHVIDLNDALSTWRNFYMEYDGGLPNVVGFDTESTTATAFKASAERLKQIYMKRGDRKGVRTLQKKIDEFLNDPNASKYRPCSLLQLATHDVCFLIQLDRIVKYCEVQGIPIESSTKSSPFYELDFILSRPQILKVGVNATHDAKLVEGTSKIRVYGVVDLEHLAAARGHPAASLRELTMMFAHNEPLSLITEPHMQSIEEYLKHEFTDSILREHARHAASNTSALTDKTTSDVSNTSDSGHTADVEHGGVAKVPVPDDQVSLPMYTYTTRWG